VVIKHSLSIYSEVKLDNKWYSCNDSSVYEIGGPKLRSRSGIVFFYDLVE